MQPDSTWAPREWPGDEGVDWDYTEADLLIELAEVVVLSPDTGKPITLLPWQKWLLREVLARHPETGRLRHRVVVTSVGRQNGKSLLGAVLSLWGLLMHSAEPLVVGVASNADQATIVYNRTKSYIDANPELAALFEKTTDTRGLTTKDGRGRYKVIASKGSSLQGWSASLAIVDELHILAPDAFNALVIGTGQRQDGLVFGITTAGDESSELLLKLYESGRAGELGFYLWAADEGASPESPDLEDQLRKANPSLACGFQSLEQALSEVKILPRIDAQRYKLNLFVANVDAWLDAIIWENQPHLDAQPTGPVVVAVDRTPDWGAASVVFAWRTGDTINTDLIASLVKPNLEQLIEYCAKLAARLPFTHFCMDRRLLADLEEALRNQGIRTVGYTAADHCRAAATTVAKLNQLQVAHPHHPLLGYQVPRGVRRTVGADGDWRLSRRDSLTEIDALTATLMAIHEADKDTNEPTQIF